MTLLLLVALAQTWIIIGLVCSICGMVADYVSRYKADWPEFGVSILGLWSSCWPYLLLGPLSIPETIRFVKTCAESVVPCDDDDDDDDYGDFEEAFDDGK